jgi:peptide/nickel transport system substrate-binding protein
MKLYRVLALALVVMIVTAGVIRAQDDKTLVIGISETIDSLDPNRGYTQETGTIFKAVYDTLVTFPKDSASEIEPMIATKWDISADNLTYTFTIRTDIKFASGNPLTADDVVYSLNRIKNLKSNPSQPAQNFASVEKVDDSTVKLTLAAPNPALLAVLAGQNGFSIVDSKLVTENGGSADVGADTADKAETWLNGHSAGSGAYVIDHWTKDVEVVLTRNPNYWGPAPYFDKVVFQAIPEAAAQKVALTSGDIDLANDLSSDDITSLKDNADVAIFSGPGILTHFLLMNRDKATCGAISDPTVELAVRYALDYDGYKTLWGGTTPATNLTGVFAGAYGEDKAFKRDTAKAKELLAQAGYPDGFEVTLDYPSYTSQGVNMETTAQKIAADLGEVGIKVTLAGGDINTKLEGYRKGDECLGYWFWGPDFFDPIDILSFLPGAAVASTRAKWDEATADKEILDLRDQARVEADPAKRITIFAGIQDYLQQKGPWAPFLVPNVQFAYASDIKDFYYHPVWLYDVGLMTR